MAQVRKWPKLAILHKIETDYATDAAPVLANAIIGTNVTFTPMEATEVGRDLLLPYMGNQGVILTGMYAQIQFEVEMTGSGTPGIPPQYGSLMRIAGMAETVAAGTSVTYSIVEDGVESGSLYFMSDGVRHVLLGCQATVQTSLRPLAIPRWQFTVMGLLGTISDVATMPAVSAAGLVAPKAVSKANSTMSLHGWDSVAESLDINLGNTLTPRFLIGDEVVLISDRSSTGTAVVEARSLATVDWFAKAISRERGALSFVHGKTAGNIVEISAPAVEIGKITQGQTNNISNYSLPLSLCPTTGRDELAIILR